MKPAARHAFKYRSGDSATLERDLESLRDDYFYAAPRSTLNDPFEGRFDRSNLDQQFRVISKLVSAVKPAISASFENVAAAADEVLAFVDKCGVFSLSKTPLDELIWAHYGGSHHGFCIEYDIAKLVEFEAKQYHCIDVQYSNSAPAFAATDLVNNDSVLPVLQKLLGTKSFPWQYESEIRVVTSAAGRHQYDYRAVKSIYFGLRCPDSTRDRLMKDLAGRGILYRQVVSSTPSYLLRAVDVVDPFQNAARYKDKIAPIAAGAIYPDYLKPELKQYSHYLSKAAEIVRREPYCEEIELVDFSGSHSKPGRLVIFVQYRRAENKWVNHYLTLPEIDERYAQLHLAQGDV